MKKIFILIGTLLLWSWRILIAGSLLFISFFLFSGAAGVFLHQQAKEVTVPPGAALVLAPKGAVLEKKSSLEPVVELINLINDEAQPAELLIQDIISGLRAAAVDDRIKLLVVAPDMLQQAGLDQLRDIGRAIEQFKASGKQVIAFADTYSQGQYYLASWSDEIYLNPMGSVDLHGFGVFNLYMRELLDKLAVNFHIFRVGAFKSAIEPLTRNNMSPEAKEDNRQWLTGLWDNFCDDIAQQRNIPPRQINDAANRFAENMKTAQGDPAVMARNNGLIDGLKTRADFRAYLKTLVGENKDKSSFQQVDFSEYISAMPVGYSTPLPAGDRVAILVAQGSIVYGRGGEGQIGSADLTKKIRKLRRDKRVKALVLRIDSGGGSAFASEMIRQELLLMQKEGKPVVISMGSMAASGAYWIAADADKIFASPCTITGSIGIFGAIPTFEKTLSKAGVFNDGIGTTGLAGSGSLTRPLSEALRRAVQVHIEQSYQRFLDIVAHGRKINPEQVEKIAQGRVWDGATALEIGLVDEMGSLEDAVAAATEAVGLSADRASYFQEVDSPAELFLRRLHTIRSALSSRKDSPLLLAVDRFLHSFTLQYNFLLKGDPQNMYSHCLLPASRLTF